jgi:prepilin-type N-terminal cleavage/methylation domain-containing protein
MFAKAGWNAFPPGLFLSPFFFPGTMGRRSHAFTLVELLVVLAVIAILAALAFPAWNRAVSNADRADSLAALRTISTAILLHAADHSQKLPGPLWPGQVMLYDPTREGRLVREIADHLGVRRLDEIHLADHLIPRAFRRAILAAKLPDTRIYVMNSSIPKPEGPILPFGSLTGSTPAQPLRLTQLGNLPAEENWMLSETDQLHPDVSGAPWKANTPAYPLHGKFRARAAWDGSAALVPVEP